MPEPVVEGLFIGRPVPREDARGVWITAIGRQAAPGPLLLGPDGLPGDAVQVVGPHGGPDRALLAYAAAHYAAWRAEAPDHAFPAPSFGENLLVAGLDEATVCLGDVYRIGGALVQVTQPRWPCATISRHHGMPELLARVLATGRVGWLHRVLAPGPIAAGDAYVLADRPHPGWSIERIYRAHQALRARDAAARETNRALLAMPELAEAWRAGTEHFLAAQA